MFDTHCVVDNLEEISHGSISGHGGVKFWSVQVGTFRDACLLVVSVPGSLLLKCSCVFCHVFLVDACEVAFTLGYKGCGLLGCQQFDLVLFALPPSFCLHLPAVYYSEKLGGYIF